MTRPDYVAMSDPTPNPQFRRHWEHPPPERRKGPAAATKGPLKKIRNGNAQNSSPALSVKPALRRAE